MNENFTLYSFKKKLAEIYKENPNEINVHRFVHPIADENNGKSLSDLHLYND